MRLADRLAVARRRRFVGRAAELALFTSALADPEPPFALLYVHGPGGVGKTVLLGELDRLAAEAGVPAVRLDGRNLDPSPPGFLAALGRALGEPPDGSPLEALARRPRGVLLVDTYETLAPLDAWLRRRCCPSCPSGTWSCWPGATRRRRAGWPTPAGGTWPGWCRCATCARTRAGPTCTPRGVPADQHPAALAFTHGHPLALSLVADVSASGGDPTAFTPEQRPDVVRALLERFVQGLPGTRHRQALEACAHVRVTTEALLASALDGDDAQELFGWLRRLSFIQEGPYGLFPHDLAREVLDADLRWRNPEGYLELHRRVRRLIVGHLRRARGLERQRAFFDLLYLHRSNPIMRAAFDWTTLGTASAEPATPEDREAVLAMVRRHEGQASARIAEHWWRRQPEAFAIFRTGGGELVGFIAGLALHRADPADLEADPAAAAARRFADRHGPARPGEELVHHRFWMGADTYQGPGSARNLMAATSCLEWLTNPRVAWGFTTHADPDDWHATMTYLNPCPGHRGRVRGGRPTLCRLRPRLAGRAGAGLAGPHGRAGAGHRPAGRPAGGRAVGAAAGPVRARVPGARPPWPTTPCCARGWPARRPPAPRPPPLSRRCCATPPRRWPPTPGNERLYRALACTFFEPAATQELAAERLGLPFSTYRYQLAGGLRRVTERLWRRELYGDGD
jgi:hypothetical protein